MDVPITTATCVANQLSTVSVKSMLPIERTAAGKALKNMNVAILDVAGHQYQMAKTAIGVITRRIMLNVLTLGVPVSIPDRPAGVIVEPNRNYVPMLAVVEVTKFAAWHVTPPRVSRRRPTGQNMIQNA